MAGAARRLRGERGKRAGDAGLAGNTAVELATTGLYKMGDGSNYATNCFPARNILHSSKEGAGRWLLAPIATPRAWAEPGTTRETAQQRRKPPRSAPVEENNEDNVLDEPFLMKHHCLKNPSDLCSVNISSQNLVSAKEDDFEKFDCVAFINAAENLLTLEPFRKFPGLRELELSLNGLRNLKITAGDFLHLEDLDLSYNNLSSEDIWTLGDLSQLKTLRLTANGLRTLPPDLAGSWHAAQLRFPALEVLVLDDNHLSDPSVFVSLSNLCSLRELNLDRNGISAVPYLRQAESRHFFLHPALDDGTFRAEWYRSLSSLRQQPQHQGTEVPEELEGKKRQLEYFVSRNNGDPARREVLLNSGFQGCPVLGVSRDGGPPASKTLPAPPVRRDVCAPFPELQRLSLAFNKIAAETALLPVAFFPRLKELTFHNNPLTTTRSDPRFLLQQLSEGINPDEPLPPTGQPPLLTRLLQQRLGIKLVRHRSLAAGRWHFSIPLKASRKVSSRLPKVKKQPLEAPAETLKPLPAERGAGPPNLPQMLPPLGPTPTALSREGGSSKLGVLGHREHSSRPPSSALEDVEAFFMTQVEDVSGPRPRPVAEDRLEKRSEQGEEETPWAVPERYKGYEELLGGDTDPEFIEPVGIQKNVQALYYILNHPLVYRDAKPRLDSLQKPYVPRKKHGRMLGPPARKTKAEVLEGILMAMRNTSTVTSIPLASALQKRKSSPRTYREALRLVEELQEVLESGEEPAPGTARLSDEVPAIKALLAEAASKQKAEKLQLRGKKMAKKIGKSRAGKRFARGSQPANSSLKAPKTPEMLRWWHGKAVRSLSRSAAPVNKPRPARTTRNPLRAARRRMLLLSPPSDSSRKRQLALTTCFYSVSTSASVLQLRVHGAALHAREQDSLRSTPRKPRCRPRGVSHPRFTHASERPPV
ncbi:X-ray radiation resistance-associated protein 1 isoform X2 [Anas platyrhynchos]|uniref:X-ray radiation resistance-associated protein 1 isoform X2 n=1 Tax=Anas platyrhynchos TaxID=8839 RepID=UPI003AF2869E